MFCPLVFAVLVMYRASRLTGLLQLDLSFDLTLLLLDHLDSHGYHEARRTD